MAPASDAVAARAESQFDATVERLSGYLRYPAISSDRAHHPDVARLAAKIAADLTALGFDDARVLSLPDALPSVAAQRLRAGPDCPTHRRRR